MVTVGPTVSGGVPTRQKRNLNKLILFLGCMHWNFGTGNHIGGYKCIFSRWFPIAIPLPKKNTETQCGSVNKQLEHNRVDKTFKKTTTFFIKSMLQDI